MVNRSTPIHLIAYEALISSSKYTGLNLRNKSDSEQRWVRVILDKPNFIKGFLDELKKVKDLAKSNTVRKVDLVVAKGKILPRNYTIVPYYTSKIFNMSLYILSGSISNEEEYVSISHNNFQTWSDSTTKTIRGNDNECLRKLLSVTSMLNS